MAEDTIPRRLQQQAKSRPDAPAFHEKKHGAWVQMTYRAYEASVRRAGKALLAVGFEKGSTVAILGFNRPEWVILDVAAMSVGGAPAGIYTTCSPEEVWYIIHHAESPVVLVEDEAQWKKVEQELSRLPKLRHVVFMRGAKVPEHPIALSWEAFLEKGDAVADARFDERLDALEPAGLATLIYTSGTTGPPKGVMLSHANLAWTAQKAAELVGGRASDRSLSYLPLSHIAEQTFSIHGPITQGSAVYFAESLEKVPDNLKEVQPTLFFGVPRIWEKFHAAIAGKLAQAKGVKKAIASLAMATGREVNAVKNEGGTPGALLDLRYRIAQKLVFSKLKPAIGLGSARVCVSGAAPIAREVLEFFSALDVVIYEVYGQSEDTGPTSFNRPGRTRLGSVGPAIPGVEVKIAPDGEILVRGPNVFLGYYKEPEATAEALVDGWLHSGDLGSFDDAGFLHITGRKKEIIITAGGKNIAPKNIEAGLKNHPIVSEAVVIGDRRKYLTALVTLDPEAKERFLKERNLGDGDGHDALRQEVQKAVDDVNTRLARVETVKKFFILPRPLSIEHGELTPTLKVKRQAVNRNFSSEIEGMYAD
jgi:long-chain acyl-CoA synthetase